MVSRIQERGADQDPGMQARAPQRPVRPLLHAVFIAAVYVILAGTWIAFSDFFLSSRSPNASDFALFQLIKGEAFVLVTGVALFIGLYRYLNLVRTSEQRYDAAQEALRQKDRAIRQGYVDVLDAVTGGKLILMTSEELEDQLGDEVLAPRSVTDPQEMHAARAAVRAAIEHLGLSDPDMLLLAFGEALTNALKHAGAAEYSVLRSEGSVQVRVQDSGRGIDFRQLPKAALVQGFSTTNTLGFGFTIMLEVSDRLLLCTDETGTSVVLETDRGDDGT